MKRVTLVLAYIILFGIIGIQFAAIIDDPQHLAEPDPNCPICLAAQTQVYITPQVSISFTPDIIVYLTDNAPGNPENENHLTSITIRAPPLS